ncbi:rab GTPase-binding effector protein 1-like isoform X1 [Lytechinus variegatus]|uniref:rab GTPase-binding effector protein 1-like isoform X1 n=2 Tax=Lytechinus variegatus TaxID=7654 RepID=UPI001BB15484|nr:rab GTPase-binding effector protein 1-like isoform X1 [Lytechinus variegatus]
MSSHDQNTFPARHMDIEGEVLSVQQRVGDLESSLQAVLQEKKLQEEDFAQKRAKFKELYLSREQELIKEVDNVREEKDRLSEELAGLKAAASVIESSKDEEIAQIKQKWTDEVASLQQIVSHTAAITAEETAMTYLMERDKLLALNEKLTQELQEISQNQGGEKTMTSSGSAGLLTSMTKSFRSLTSATTSPSPTREEKLPLPQTPSSPSASDNLEQSMLKAQKDTELLRAVVVPLENEIESLKQKLSDVHSDNRLLQARLKKAIGSKDFSDAVPSADDCEVTKDDINILNEKIKDLNKVLETEKAARTDLELYVAVLGKQKQVMQDEGDEMRTELKDVCCILEQEKQAHSQLQQTWQMANDQFLESQRLQMMDMRRMESVLTEEQQRQIAELLKKDQEREEQEKKVKVLKEKRENLEKRHSKETAEQEVTQQASPAPVQTNSSSLLSRDDIEDSDDALLVPSSMDTPISSTPSRLHPSINFVSPNVDPEALLQFDTTDSASGAKSTVHGSLSEIGAQSGHNTSDLLGTSYDSVSLSSTISLTEAQERAISGTPESEEMKSVLASARSKTDLYSLLAGKRVVSDTEWTKIQEEIRFAREKLGRPCDMCTNYEQQLQGLQTKYSESVESSRTLRQQLEQEIDNVLREQKIRSELEESLKNAAEDAQIQIKTLTTKNGESEQLLSNIRHQYLKSQNELHSQMQILFESREQLYQEVTKLQKENDSLSAKRSLHQSLQSSEPFDLPTSPQELSRLCMKYRDDIITVRVNADHTESSLRSELSFTREQLESEQHQRMTMEDTYQTELDDYKEELLVLRNLREDYEKEKKTRGEVEETLREVQESKKSMQGKSKEVITALREQVEELSAHKTNLEAELQERRKKNQNLQSELENSEAVQKDFVKLSQSLQVQLEVIRQKDNEVRWQHEDDADKCNNCKTVFGTSKKKKNHCKHCGKVFCPDCVTKSVESGPRRRKMPVCDVCHTLLVNESAPYFSKEAPDNT